MSKSGNTFIALLAGAAVGAGIGLLYAPESGDKTRKKLTKTADDVKKKIDKQLKETTATLSESATKAKKSFDKKLDETLTSASSKADDILVSLEQKLEDLRKKNATYKANDAAEDFSVNEEATV